ncbi:MULTISPECIES: hypothetical protein [Pseudomonas]|uniref:hypothetical protein n=1 Tax=Pseudomonas TaxID=286 RepID=UPI00235EADB2|nr:hypothetical protein [Pseudomonas sp. SBT1-2]
MTEIKRYIIDQSRLPNDYPTHIQPAEFWEVLGRTVATFGLLEDVLCKAIFALTATKPYSDAEIASAYEKWVTTMERSLSDPLGNLIDTYGKAVREHPEATISNCDDLLKDLRAASKVRNVLCHGAWRTPDPSGASIPFYVNKQSEQFDTPIDKAWLEITRRHAVELICAVVDSVTYMGFQFPSSSGPGVPVWNNNNA